MGNFDSKQKKENSVVTEDESEPVVRFFETKEEIVYCPRNLEPDIQKLLQIMEECSQQTIQSVNECHQNTIKIVDNILEHKN